MSPRELAGRPLFVEALEARTLLSAAALPILPNLIAGTPLSPSTIPGNGDVNPYGVAFVPSSIRGAGKLRAGDILVSNFNNSHNQQGTGTTIVDISPTGQSRLFFQGKGLGLTTALGVLQGGVQGPFVLVGSLPATYDSQGNLMSIGQGSLLLLNANGQVVTTLTDPNLLDGPWDLTINDQGSQAQVFVSNVLNGTVTRIDLSVPVFGTPTVRSMTQIASGYAFGPNMTALVVGPTGLAYDTAHDILYVASTADNAIFAIAHARNPHTMTGTGSLIYQDDAHLRGPLALAMAPNGDLLTTNGDAINPDPNHQSELIEFTPGGQFVNEVSVDSAASGAAFGMAVQTSGDDVRLAAVDDNFNALDVWTIDAAQSVSTVPRNGDLNPYGVAFVPPQTPSIPNLNISKLHAGDILVSNFNNSQNRQGTGSTIVDISPNGGHSLFFQGPAGLGLTTALGVLQRGFVLVGNLPATYDRQGNLVSIGQGSLLLLNASGQVVTTLTDPSLLDGPWDLTINDQGSQAQVFVSNVLNGTVTRINLSIPLSGTPTVHMTQIASGYQFRTDPTALVVGPTGLAYDTAHDILYVASTADNAIFAIAGAKTLPTTTGTGSLIYQDDAHLRGPLALALAPNGDLLTSNGDAINSDPNHQSELIEFTPGGQFVNEVSVDSAASGAAFGFAVQTNGEDVRLAAVDDNLNTLDVWTTDIGNEILPGAVTGSGGSQGARALEGAINQAPLVGQDLLDFVPAARDGRRAPGTASLSLDPIPASHASAVAFQGRFTDHLGTVSDDSSSGPDGSQGFSTHEHRLNAVDDFFTTLDSSMIGMR